MKRDMALVHEILKALESQPKGALSTLTIANAIAKGDEEKQSLVLNHLRIMQDAGYIAQESGGVRLTWAGHDRAEEIKGPMKVSASTVETFAKLGK
jgi:Mn-dependent DtxR family transcriptional regulator